LVAVVAMANDATGIWCDDTTGIWIGLRGGEK